MLFGVDGSKACLAFILPCFSKGAIKDAVVYMAISRWSKQKISTLNIL